MTSTMRRRGIPIVVAVVMLAAACGGGGSGCSGSPGAAGSGGAPTLPPSPTALPTFDLASFRTLLSSLHGRPVVVNIWASWCGPCIVEAPHLAQLSRQTRGRVQFVGVDILDQRVPARRFIQRFGWTYPSVFDPSGSIRDGLGLIGQPNTVLFDANGRRVRTWSGVVDPASLSAEIETLLKT